MSYRRLPDLNQTTAEDVERMRRTMGWLLPLVMIQQGIAVHRDSDRQQQQGYRSPGVATSRYAWLNRGEPHGDDE